MLGSLSHDGGKNFPGIPSACATRNFTYLAIGPLSNWYALCHYHPGTEASEIGKSTLTYGLRHDGHNEIKEQYTYKGFVILYSTYCWGYVDMDVAYDKSVWYILVGALSTLCQMHTMILCIDTPTRSPAFSLWHYHIITILKYRCMCKPNIIGIGQKILPYPYLKEPIRVIFVIVPFWEPFMKGFHF